MTDDRKPNKALRIATIAILGGCLLVVIGWDFIVGTNAFRGDTVSEVTIWAALRSLTLPAALGVICGHLTWPASARNPVWIVTVTLVPLLICLVALDALTWAGLLKWHWLFWLRSWPIITLLVMLVVGRLVWPQARQ